MLIYNVASIICFLLMAVALVYVIANILFLKRTEKILFIRDFKKGKVAFIYVVALPLYFMANIYCGDGIFVAFSSAFEGVVDLIAFSVDAGNTLSLCAVSSVYKWALYFSYIAVYFNGLMFLLSLCLESIWSFVHSIQFHCSRKTKCVIVGNNENSIVVYESCKEKNVLLADKMDRESKTQLYLDGYKYKSFVRWDLLVQWVVRESKRMARFHRLKGKRLYDKKQKLVLIINTQNDIENLSVCGHLVQALASQDEHISAFLEAYVYVGTENKDVYAEYERKCKGCLHQVDKYTLSAMDFIHQYPLTQYMDERHIDYETAYLKKDVDVNVFFIGFGKRNRRLFLSMVANNQFITAGEQGEPVVKPVHYYLFDKDESEKHRNLNHTYYRYRHNFVEKRVDENAYLPLPQLPAEESYLHLDINSIDFYDQIKDLIGKKSTDVNYVIVGVGDDLLNMDIAKKLREKLNEWNYSNVWLFTSVQDVNLRADAEKLGVLQGYALYGGKRESEYNYAQITKERFGEMARRRNYAYDVEYELSRAGGQPLTKEYLLEQAERSTHTWYAKRTNTERESNVYACLSLRQKLHLLGLDFEKDTGTGLSYDAYMETYAKDDKPVVKAYNEALAKPIVGYTLDLKKSKRYALAVHEHYRWNAYMITKGFVPADKNCIKEEKDANGKHTNGKSYALRRHGNLTTMQGLVEFRRILAERKGTSEAEEDVIKYDYQLMDDAYWLLKEEGYQLVKRRENSIGN